MASLGSVLDIDGNRHVFDRLRNLIESRRAIAFSGAGASAGLYPLWPELVNLLIGEAMRRGLASDADRRTWERFATAEPQQVVRGVKEKLGRAVYGAVLRELFGYRGDPAHTDVQGLLVRLPFRGHITTNYDLGLLEARRLFRPDVRATGYATWQDHDALRAWHTGEVFGECACPVLYAHGVLERSDTIVLGASEYREAYRPGPFRELVRGLWGREHLVFVGFGFTDSWFRTVAEEVLELTREGAGEPRHVAIVGLPDGEPYSHELRKLFRDAYGAEVLLYPVVGGDHDALATLLAELSGSRSAPTQPFMAAVAPMRGEVRAAAEMAACHAQLEGWIGEEALTPVGPAGPSRHGSHGYQRSFQRGIIAWSEATGAHPIAYAVGAVHARFDGLRGTLGFPVSHEMPAKSRRGTKGKLQRFEGAWTYPGRTYGAAVYWTEQLGAHPTWGGIGQCYEESGGTRGPLGFPTSEEMDVCSERGTIGVCQRFESGFGTWFEGPAYLVWGAIGERFAELGAVEGRLGFPVGPEGRAAKSRRGTQGKYQRFEGGKDDVRKAWHGEPREFGTTVYWTVAAGAHVVWGAIGEAFEAQEGTVGQLGFPVSDESEAWPSWVTAGWLQRFEGPDEDYPDDVIARLGVRCGATLYWSYGYGGVVTSGAIGARYERLGGTGSGLGFPCSREREALSATGERRGRRQRFEGGVMFWCPEQDAIPVFNRMLGAYERLKATEGPLGFPMSDEVQLPSGPRDAVQVFEGGVITALGDTVTVLAPMGGP